MHALLHHPPVFKHINAICVLDGAQPMRDGDRGAAFRRFVKSSLDCGFGGGVEGRGCFVEEAGGVLAVIGRTGRAGDWGRERTGSWGCGVRLWRLRGAGVGRRRGACLWHRRGC
jgi:hypothetical protein